MGDVTNEFKENVYSEPPPQKPVIDITINVPMPPKGKQRPRARVLAGGKRATVYTDKKQRTWESDFRDHARRQMPAELLSGALRVDVVAYIKRPQRLYRRADPEGPLFCVVTPDADNILKSTTDALAVFFTGSDAAVAQTSCVKVYTEKHTAPRVLVRIRSLEPGTVERQAIQRVLLGAS